MLSAGILSVLIGLALGFVAWRQTKFPGHEDMPTAIAVGVSGAIAGWAIIDTLFGAGTHNLDAWDAVGAIAGSLIALALATRGARRHPIV